MTPPRAMTALAISAFLAVTGCSANSHGSDPPAPTRSSTSVAVDLQQDHPVVDRGQVLATNFVSDFRQRFPDLAQRRSDNGIADGGARICNAVVEQGITKEIVLRRLSTTFEHDGTTLNADQSLVLLRMAVFGICPERRAALRELTG